MAAVEGILNHGHTADTLPLIRLQHDLFVLYSNTIVPPEDIIKMLHRHVQYAAFSQRKVLDICFAHITKEQPKMSDMREKDNSWCVSWEANKHSSLKEDQKGAFGVLGGLFCASFEGLMKSVREVKNLLVNLAKEGLILHMNFEEVEEKINWWILEEFFKEWEYFDLHHLLPVLAFPFKHNFVYSSSVGVKKRMELSKYTPISNQKSLPSDDEEELDLPPARGGTSSRSKLGGLGKFGSLVGGIKDLMNELFDGKMHDEGGLSPFLLGDIDPSTDPLTQTVSQVVSQPLFTE